MVDYPYRMQLAEDPTQVGYVARDATITFFSSADKNGEVPLVLTDPTGAPLSNPITTSSDGMVPAFRAPVQEVMWRGAGISGFMTSYEGLLAEARGALALVDQASQSAAAAAMQEVLRLAATGEFDGPPGEDGDPGLPGTNGVTSDQAMADLVGLSTSVFWTKITGVLANTYRPVGEGYVSVRAYGAKGDDVTDDYDAIVKAQVAARAAGHCRIYFPAGAFGNPKSYRTRQGIRQGNDEEIYGDGRQSVIKLTDAAPVKEWVIINADRTNGNKNLRVRDLTLDWNQTRQGGLQSNGGSRSSCLTYGNVDGFHVKNVFAKNPGNHCFDITCAAEDYPYTGDGSPDAVGPSKNGLIEKCEGTGWGDDGITTHHSTDVTIMNNFMYSPRNKDNCNGIEIDDGSRNMTLIANRTAFCYGGLEIKAHATASAGNHINVIGHDSYRDVRSYHFRHIGHHIATDPKSKSAFGIVASNLYAREPGNRTGFQDDVIPRALQISAFVNVLINGFYASADPTYNFNDESVVNINYMAGNVIINDASFEGFTTANYDIYITGSGNQATRVIVNGLNCYKSSKRILGCGAENPMVSVDNVNAVAPDGALYAFDFGYSTENVNVGTQMNLVGYPTAVRFDGTNFPTMSAWQRRTSSVPVNPTTGVPTVTRMADLDVSKDYYASSTIYGAFTDGPVGQGGGNWVTHSRMTGASVIQTVTRNSSSAGLQMQHWRVLDYSAKTAGPWNQTIVGGSVTQGVPVGVTRLVDLDVSKDYYAATATFEALTDRPFGHGGGNWITHQAMNGTSVIQTVTRNSSSGSLQARQWRTVDYSAKTAGPWNNSGPVTILGMGVLPPAGTPVGAIFYQRTA